MEPIGDMPEDPYPNVEVTTLNMDEIACLIVVDLNGHLTVRTNVNNQYLLYVTEQLRERVLQRISDGIGRNDA